LLNDETPKMIKLASKNAVAVFLNTNGTVLKEKAVAVVDSQPVVINISLDGAVSKSTHLYNSKYTFDDVARGVESLSNQKVKMGFNYPQIHGQFILTDETVDEIESLKKWAKNIGVEYTKFKRQHSTMPGELEREKFFSKPDFEQLTKHKKLKSSENLDFSPKECSHPWDSIFLSCEGNIGICSFDPQQILTLGHNTEDFSTLWNSDLAKQVRKWHSGNCNEIGEPCSKCNRLPGYLLPAEKIEIRT
jgi:radical SAM protein with 4Fe4S-binding SPASM domain